MLEKLQTAQAMMGDLARSDVKALIANGEKLCMISQASEWHKTSDSEFMHQAKSFQNSVDFLLENAKANNQDGMAMGWVRITLDCMQCHHKARVPK